MTMKLSAALLAVALTGSTAAFTVPATSSNNRILSGRRIEIDSLQHATRDAVSETKNVRNRSSKSTRSRRSKNSTQKSPAKDRDIRQIERKIVHLGRAGRTDEAISLYDSVWVGYENRSGLKPTTRLMNAAIDACARARPPRIQTAFALLKEGMGGGVRGAAKLTPNVYTAGALMSCCARARDSTKALKFLREMKEKYGISPNGVVYSTAISACERSQPARADVALHLLREATSDPTIEMGVVGYNTAISALARVGDWRTALQVLEEMESRGRTSVGSTDNCEEGRTSVLESPLVSAEILNPPEPDEGRTSVLESRLVGAEIFNPPEPDEVSYGTVMAACERAGEWRHVLRVADRIDAKAKDDPAFAMDGLALTSALHACQQLGLADKALTYLDSMKNLPNEEGGERVRRRRTNGNARMDARKPLRGPDDVAYKLAISACSRSKSESRWAAGVKLLQEMESVTGTAPDVIAYTACIAGCAEAGEWGAAFQLLEEMKAKGCEPNVVTLSACISSCATACANASKGATDIEGNRCILEPKEQALRLLRAMNTDKSRVKPNIVTYNAAIRACAEAFDMDRAFLLFEELKQLGLEPSVVTYGTLMTACERVGNLDAASRAMKMIREENGRVRPNEVIYGAAISCCRKSREAERVILLLRKMIKEELSPNIATFNTAIMAQFEANKPDVRAATLIYKLIQSDHAPRIRANRQTYSILVRGLAENLRPNDAEVFLRKMQTEGFVPDVDLFTALVGSYERTGQPGKALQLMESMERDGYNFYEIKVLDDAFKKAVKFASAVERATNKKNKKDELNLLYSEEDDNDDFDVDRMTYSMNRI